MTVRKSLATIDEATNSFSEELAPRVKWNRYFLLVVFTLTIALTCSYFLNGNGVRQVWLKAGVPCKYGDCEDCECETVPPKPKHDLPDDLRHRTKRIMKRKAAYKDAESQMSYWLKLFQSAELLAFYSGFYLDILGPKVTHITGQLALVGAVVLVAKGHIVAGMIISGLTTQLILNSVMCIANLFPHSQNLIMAILSGACDLSQFLFPVAYFIGNYWPSFDYSFFLKVLCAFSFAGAVVSVAFLPFRPFEMNGSGYVQEVDVLSDIQSDAALLGTSECSTKKNSLERKLEHLHDEVVAMGGSPYWRMPLWRQILNRHYFIFSLFWAQLILRMYLYLDSNEAIIRKHGDDGTMAGIFGFIIPCSCVSCVFLGVVADKVGVLYTAALVNLAATMVNVISLFPFLHLQWVAVLIFTLYKSYLFTLLYAFIAETFGFSNFGVLTVLPAFAGGITNQFIGVLFLRFAAHMDQDWFYPNIVQIVLGVSGQVLVAYLSKISPFKKEFTEQIESTLHRERFTHVCGFAVASKDTIKSFVSQGEKDMLRLSGACYI